MAATTHTSSGFGRTSYYVLTGGLAIIFLFPLAWSLFASVSPQALTGQPQGYGFGNYSMLFKLWRRGCRPSCSTAYFVGA